MSGGEGTVCSDGSQSTEFRNQGKLQQTCLHREPGSVGNSARAPAQEPTPTFALPAESRAGWVGAAGAVRQGQETLSRDNNLQNQGEGKNEEEKML